MVFLATAATVIASQAVITGAFSVAHQAVQLGYLPRLRIAHTSSETVGQIYVPWINWLLMISVLTLVFAFESSAALAFAFGMAVTGTITITTLLFFYIVRHQWGKPLWLVAGGAGALLTVDLLFLAANMTKIAHGAWLPLLIAVTVFTVLTTWQRGRELVTARREAGGGLAARRSSTRCTSGARRCSGPRAPRSSSTATRRRRRWRCGPTSSTTGSSTSTSSSSRSRRSRFRRFRPPSGSRSTTSATATTASPTSPPASATWSSPTSRRALRLAEAAGLECPLEVERSLLLPLDDRAAAR